jgi:photosystem II stability/assembly factor-like uncharacterized protein
MNRAILMTIAAVVAGMHVCSAQAETSASGADMLAGAGLKLAIDPQNTATLYAATNKGLYKSSDSGTAWTRLSSGLPDPLRAFGPSDVQVDPRHPNVLYVTYPCLDSPECSGLYKSVDGGNHWAKVLHLGGPQTVAIDPQNTEAIYVGAWSGDLDGTTGIYRSPDGGVSWEGTSLHKTMALVIDPKNPDTIYAAGQGVLKSTDRGRSWSLLKSPFNYAHSFAVDPQNLTLYAATGPEGLFKSVDGGTTWINIASDLGFKSAGRLALDPQSSTLYASFVDINGSDIFKTTDAGLTWTALPKRRSVLIYSIAVDPVSPSIVYAGTESGFWKSFDRGTTWSANSQTPILAIRTVYCTGSGWYLRVSNAPADCSIHLLGVSNGVPWKVSNWRTTDSIGVLVETGAFKTGRR